MLDEQDRLAVGGIRLLLGAVTLVVLGAGRISFGEWRRRDVLPLVVGGAGVAGFQVAYFGAVGIGGVAVSTAVGIGLSPVFTGLWAAARSRRRPSPIWLAGTVVAVAGLILLAFGGGADVHVSGAGLLLSVVAAACFSMQIGSIQVLANRHGDAAALTALFGVGAVLLIPTTVFAATSSLLATKTLLWVIYLGVVTTGVAYWLFSRGVRHLGAAAATTISLLEPVGAAVIAAAVLGESISFVQWAGIAAICGAVLAISLGRAPRTGARVPETDERVEEFV
jgi:DME family drug/metabolite transporter